MNFNWANQFAKNALKTAQKRIDSVLDIAVDEADTVEEELNAESRSRFDVLPEESEEDANAGGGWDDHEPNEVFSDEPTLSEPLQVEGSAAVDPAACASPSHEWGSQWRAQAAEVVDSEPNPIRDSHHAGSYQHSPSSTSPDEGGCSGEDPESSHPREEPKEELMETVDLAAQMESTATLQAPNDSSVDDNGAQSSANHHDDTLTVTSSDIEVLRQSDTWSIMSATSSAMPKEIPMQMQESISLQPHLPHVSSEGARLASSNLQSAMAAEIAQLKTQIQYQERRIGDLQAQNQRLEKKTHDVLALKAARHQQSSTEAKLMKKLGDKEAELAGLLQEGEKLAEQNGKLTKEMKRLRTSLAEQEQLAKKGAQAEIDRDLAKEEVRGLVAENNKLRAAMKAMEADSSKGKAAEEIFANDLRKRDEKIKKLTADVQRAEAGREAAFEEVKRLEGLLQEVSIQVEEREMSNRGIEEMTKGLNAVIEEERQKNERQTTYIDSLEKRLCEVMDSQRETAEMVAMANAPLLETIHQLQVDLEAKESSYTAHLLAKNREVEALNKEKVELTCQCKEMSADLKKLQVERDEATTAANELKETMRELVVDNKNFQIAIERCERIAEGLKISLSGKEVEIEKLYSRMRAEAEIAERQSSEKQERIDSLLSRCGELEKELAIARESKAAPSRNVSFANDPAVSDRAPFISSSAAQSELLETIAKYDQSMRQIAALQAKLAEGENDSRALFSTRKELQDLRVRYESLLEAHGEKIERIEELELDLADVKKLFRDQMEMLIGKN